MNLQNDILKSGDISFRGVIFPWDCDSMGHLNSKNYYGIFDQAGWHVFLAFGYQPQMAAGNGIGLADINQQMTFKRELTAGKLVYVRSYVDRVGTKSITVRHEMYDAETRECTSVLVCTTAFFNLRSRSAMEIPSRIRTVCESWLSAKDAATPS